jgi:hypothetical protein
MTLDAPLMGLRNLNVLCEFKFVQDCRISWKLVHVGSIWGYHTRVIRIHKNDIQILCSKCQSVHCTYETVRATYLITDAQNSPSNSGIEDEKFRIWHIRSLVQDIRSHTTFFRRTTRQCSNIEISTRTPLPYKFEDFSDTFVMSKSITRT